MEDGEVLRFCNVVMWSSTFCIYVNCYGIVFVSTNVVLFRFLYMPRVTANVSAGFSSSLPYGNKNKCAAI
jgi:hypothetical protein